MLRFLSLSLLIYSWHMPAVSDGFGLGRDATHDEIIAWDIDIRPDGMGLPNGVGSVLDGEGLYTNRCASCHGDFGEGMGRWPELAGGFDTLDGADPVKTVGSYWPYLSTVFDYVYRAMPFGYAQSLKPNEVYAITAYILYLNDLVDEDFELNNKNFTEIKLPNEQEFYLDDRSNYELKIFSSSPCMTRCKDKVRITKRARILDVTPADKSIRIMAEKSKMDGAIGNSDLESTERIISVTATGETVFNKKCIACHEIGEGAKNKFGPQLNQIFSRPLAGLADFEYSDSLVSLGVSGTFWNLNNMKSFLKSPQDFAKGTKMIFAGLKDDEELKSVMMYLESFSQQSKHDEKKGQSIEVILSDEILALEGDKEYGQYLSSDCTTCHLESGGNNGIPSIVNLSEKQILLALHAYKKKIRKNPVMQMMAGRLGNEEIAALAVYFSQRN